MKTKSVLTLLIRLNAIPFRIYYTMRETLRTGNFSVPVYEELAHFLLMATKENHQFHWLERGHMIKLAVARPAALS